MVMSDEYGIGKSRAEEPPDLPRLIGLGMSLLGVFLLMIGLIYAIIVFGIIRDVIETPDTFVANLDAWVGPEESVETAVVPEEPVEAAAPTVENSPGASGNEGAQQSDENEASTELAADADLAQGVKEAMEGTQPSREKLAVRSQPVTDAETAFEEFLSLIRDGRMGRIAGAMFIFLFVILLSQIPLAIMRIGVQLLIAGGGKA